MNPPTQPLVTEHFESEFQAESYLQQITRVNYTFAMASQRKWGANGPIEYGQFYQIMPDGIDTGFFDWYCIDRPYYQFFTSMEAAVLHFVYYWHVWSSK
jgi:hypothetical protein